MEFPQAGSGPNRKQIIDALRNTAQSASNMVAENVSMPMDAIAWALRKAGVPVEKPMFGSDWMKEKGVTPPVREGASKVIGDTIGMISPMGLTKQGAKAMVDGVGKLKGLPVGMSIKDVSPSSFSSTSKDASEIFGAGHERIKYLDPNSQGYIEVLKKPDGTASVLGLEVPEQFRGQGIGQNLQQYAMTNFPELQGQVSSRAAAKTAYRLGRRPANEPNASLDDVYRIMDDNSSVNLVTPQMQQKFNAWRGGQ
jgi:predicted GNAT family acetyltransferase